MPINIGVAGLGRMGRIHASNLRYRLPEARLVAVCAHDQNHLAWAQRHLNVDQYPSVETMIQNQKMDAIILATPSAFHPIQIQSCVDAGLHVFCEKPIAIDREGIEMISTVQLQPLKSIIQIGFMRRFDKSYLSAKSMVEQGEIGQPILYRGYTADSIKFIDESIRVAANSAGQFLDMAIHDIDLMRWFLGSEPSNVMAAGGSYAYEFFEQHQDGDNVAAFFHMENQTMAFLYAGRTAAHGYFVESEIIGTMGSLRIGCQPNADFVEVLDRRGRNQSYVQNFEERFKRAFVDELGSFCSAVERHDHSATNIHDALQATKIALGATESFRINELVSFL